MPHPGAAAEISTTPKRTAGSRYLLKQGCCETLIDWRRGNEDVSRLHPGRESFGEPQIAQHGVEARLCHALNETRRSLLLKKLEPSVGYDSIQPREVGSCDRAAVESRADSQGYSRNGWSFKVPREKTAQQAFVDLTAKVVPYQPPFDSDDGSRIVLQPATPSYVCGKNLRDASPSTAVLRGIFVSINRRVTDWHDYDAVILQINTVLMPSNGHSLSALCWLGNRSDQFACQAAANLPADPC